LLICTFVPEVSLYRYTPEANLEASKVMVCDPAFRDPLTSVATFWPNALNTSSFTSEDCGMVNVMFVVGLNGFGKF